MANPQLVQYIRESMAKGISRDPLTKLLADAGWSSADVQEAFASLTNAVPNAPAEIPAQNIPTTEFLAEMERRRKAAEAAQPAAQVVSDSAQITTAPASVTSEKGLIGLLFKTGLVKTKQQANAVLIVVLVVVLGTIVWINWP